MAGLYVHIPFCHSKCAYCDFYSIPNQSKGKEYVDAIMAEYEMRKTEIAEPFKTLYIGGGTPSSLPLEDLRRLITALKTTSMKEITVEANPEDVNDTWATAIASMGVNRVSMGFQSMIDEELKFIGRRHSSRQAIEAVKALRQAGITNISGDLIYGLPGQSIESWRYSLATVLDMQLPHLSAYSLSYEQGTRLYAMLISGKIRETDESTYSGMYDILCRQARAAGYEHYEISNFALPGMRSRHNSAYWEYVPYLGLGCAAHSFDGKTRRSNLANINQYLSQVERHNPPYHIEDENRTDLYNDYIITALRTSEGINLDKMNVLFDTQGLLAAAQPYITQGLMTRERNHIKIAEQAWLISDAILRDLIVVDE